MIPLNIESRQTYRYALLHLGFRPFFLSAMLLALLSMALWMGFYHAAWRGLPANYPSLLWHAHEMIFGYGVAVAAGFLLTAIKNWTGLQTLHQKPLLGLVLLWLAARVLVFVPNLGVWLAALFDLLFLAALLVAVARPIWRVKQWQQLAFVGKIALFFPANVLFYLGLLLADSSLARLGLYIGFYLILALILNMGRRVIPFFIERGLGCPFEAKNYLWLDRLSLGLFLVFALLDSLALTHGYGWAQLSAGGLALALLLLHGIRLYGWHHPQLWRKPLLWVLFVAYVWLLVGFALKGLCLWLSLSPFLAIHAFAVGGIGMMTVGMMARVTLGHTGRDVFAPPPALNWVFFLLIATAIVRVFLPWALPNAYAHWILLAQMLWIGAFALLLWQYAPLLMKPRTDGRYG